MLLLLSRFNIPEQRIRRSVWLLVDAFFHGFSRKYVLSAIAGIVNTQRLGLYRETRERRPTVTI